MKLKQLWKLAVIGFVALTLGLVLLESVLLLRFGPDRIALEGYENTRGWIRAERDRLAGSEKIEGANEDRVIAVSELWLRVASDKIFPAWYGTPWDFHGTAGSPSPGLPGSFLFRNDLERKIACGHFVGSVMEDLGFDVDRKAVGRQAAGDIIHTFVADPDLIRSFQGSSKNRMFDEIEEMGQGLFIVGLDSHTGFIVSDDLGLHFVHASGRFPRCVLRESARRSSVLRHSRLVMIGKFSDDRNLATRWLSGHRISVQGGR